MLQGRHSAQGVSRGLHVNWKPSLETLSFGHKGRWFTSLCESQARPPRCLPQAGLVQKSIFFVLHMCFAPAVGLALTLSRDGPYPQKWKLLVIV